MYPLPELLCFNAAEMPHAAAGNKYVINHVKQKYTEIPITYLSVHNTNQNFWAAIERITNITASGI